MLLFTISSCEYTGSRADHRSKPPHPSHQAVAVAVVVVVVAVVAVAVARGSVLINVHLTRLLVRMGSVHRRRWL